MHKIKSIYQARILVHSSDFGTASSREYKNCYIAWDAYQWHIVV